MVLLTVMSCGASKDPVEYNNAVITVINGSGAYIGKMNAAMESKNYDEAEKVRVDWAKAVDADIKKKWKRSEILMAMRVSKMPC